jgi:hypothetical protein
MTECPLKKRDVSLVAADRRAEFENAVDLWRLDSNPANYEGMPWLTFQPYGQGGRWHDWFAGRKPSEPARLTKNPTIDLLHQLFPGQHRWRIVAGTGNQTRRHFRPMFSGHVRWVAVVFNNAADAVEFRLKWEPEQS